MYLHASWIYNPQPSKMGKPIFIFIFGTYFELEIQMISILVLFAVLPTAPSSFILARQLGGNIGLMSSIITIQTLLSMIFIILFLKLFI